MGGALSAKMVADQPFGVEAKKPRGLTSALRCEKERSGSIAQPSLCPLLWPRFPRSLAWSLGMFGASGSGGQGAVGVPPVGHPPQPRPPPKLSNPPNSQEGRHYQPITEKEQKPGEAECWQPRRWEGVGQGPWLLSEAATATDASDAARAGTPKATRPHWLLVPWWLLAAAGGWARRPCSGTWRVSCRVSGWTGE